ncbi:SecYEG protein translocase auxillary subunit [Legionella sainthelensi]|uniref:Sec translocon accessory complex subunit YajC n=1 Tax=Legionella sainthelensi TaxID=28087 RepID=A0A0W0YBS8_9GAMM|nr:preprotein translocase subunit YajC [Legionella sainthelensi]KTD54194.1 SecYEG protein translocase auxillary subunit [Legionella sainthelensi]VEB34435.1 SecYEG protein translocase auxillary subunit [Legionella sainthelensi]VEH29727.1 SecYEG protein translocase auxillary subunit [Legionella sainthelensi]
MSFFISDAMAAAGAAPAPQADGTFSLIMIAAIFVLFYFMLIRPQNKRAKEHRDLVSKLKKGDEIITSGGILAKVVSLDEQYIKISLAEGVEINLQRGAVSAVLPKGTLKSL